jgi:hypothetical protein
MPRPGFADHLQAELPGKHRPQALPDDSVIVDDHNSYLSYRAVHFYSLDQRISVSF